MNCAPKKRERERKDEGRIHSRFGSLTSAKISSSFFFDACFITVGRSPNSIIQLDPAKTESDRTNEIQNQVLVRERNDERERDSSLTPFPPYSVRDHESCCRILQIRRHPINPIPDQTFHFLPTSLRNIPDSFPNLFCFFPIIRRFHNL